MAVLEGRNLLVVRGYGAETPQEIPHICALDHPELELEALMTVVASIWQTTT